MAYGAVVYLFTMDGYNHLVAKTKVVPLKPQTLSRLDLQALCLDTRLACNAWKVSESQWHRFVADVIGERCCCYGGAASYVFI